MFSPWLVFAGGRRRLGPAPGQIASHGGPLETPNHPSPFCCFGDGVRGHGHHRSGDCAAGSVYVTGGIQSETASYEYATLKYDTNGKQKWVIRYSGPKDFDIGETIALDGSNNVIVSGDSYGSNGWTTIKYLQVPDTSSETAEGSDAVWPPGDAGY